MRGRDFSDMEHILSHESMTFLERRGDSFLEHERLSKMYFESIWSIGEIQRVMFRSGMQFEPSDAEQFMHEHHQMLFDVITFYNIANANQLYRSHRGEWQSYSFFRTNTLMNNRFLSAVWYIQYFRRTVNDNVADSVKLRHLLFLNALSMIGVFKNRIEFISVIKKCANCIEELEGFCEYSSEMGSGFINYDLEKDLVNYIRREIDYYLALPVAMQQKYYQYVKQVGFLVAECECCADRQKNYGLTQCEFEDVLEKVI